jgi:hypothetical protein
MTAVSRRCTRYNVCNLCVNESLLFENRPMYDIKCIIGAAEVEQKHRSQVGEFHSSQHK